MMRKALCLAALAAFLLPAVASAKTFKNVPVVDSNCSSRVINSPDNHTRACALKCAASGFGIVTNDHKFLKFDSAGNEEIVSQLKNSTEKDHLRVDVTGEVQGDTLQVKSVKLL
jgi:ribosomal protein S5